MRRQLGLGIAAVAVAFLVITFVKGRPASDVASSRQVSVTGRDTIVQFWERYRSATDHRLAGRTQQAIDAYEHALALNEGHEDALYYIGNMYRDAGRTADARDAWGRLVAVNPQSARAHAELADLHFCFPQDPQFDLQRAEAELRLALVINKEETGPLFRLGQLALVKGEFENARAYFDQVIASNHTSVPAHVLRGYIAWNDRKIDEALAFFGRAVHLDRPQAPIGGVPGEGDTKTGSAPLVAEQQDCWGLESVTRDLDRVTDAGLARAMGERYSLIKTVLRQ